MDSKLRQSLLNFVSGEALKNSKDRVLNFGNFGIENSAGIVCLLEQALLSHSVCYDVDDFKVEYNTELVCDFVDEVVKMQSRMQKEEITKNACNLFRVLWGNVLRK